MIAQHLDEKGQRDRQGRTALILAAQNGRDGAVEALVKHEGGVSGWTSLIYFAYFGDSSAVRGHLHESRCTDITGMTALMSAAQGGHTGCINFLSEKEGGRKDKSGCTAFIHALKNKHKGIALLLRTHEAPSWTLLMCAAFAGEIEVAKKHLNDKDKKNNDGDTALMIAARGKYESIVELLDPTYNGITALMRAIDRSDMEGVASYSSSKRRT